MKNKQQFIKGLIGEEIAKFHLENMGFNVIHTGKESLDKELADNYNQINKFRNIENGNTYQLYNHNIANNILAQKELFSLFEKTELLIRNSDHEIRSVVNEKLIV